MTNPKKSEIWLVQLDPTRGQEIQKTHRYNINNYNTNWASYSMTLQELKNQILALPPTEKAAIIQSLTQSINIGAKGITKIPGVCGGEACIAGTRIAIWLLVEARRLGITEVQLLQDYPHISAADLVNAWIYADAYPQEIEAAILANEVA
jgi:uncharacterized protein (DUF433 family)